MDQDARTVIFDLDGTLADTSGDLLAAANGCFRDLGLGDLLDARDAGVALRGGRAMLALGFSRSGSHGTLEVERQYPNLLRRYEEAICDLTTLYPGAVEAVERLRSAGYRTGICTNKPEALAEALLGKLGVRALFDSLVGADTLAVRKPDPLPFTTAVERAGGVPSRACLVGDSDTDHRTARAAGVPSILVSFGPSGEDMAALGPEVVLGSFDDLPQAVDGLFL
ncbi:HAD-IA family hydrolase [Rubellimicrobium arenae]|uniref:HAD-IA family hydrolase n=1 Tax=Rubellimicrobium arenae TaxID=2817372 RepID=UPI001B30F2BB|nr:HAD-IA family hydrolase [Rubellimicrobium arenae]